MVQEAVAAHCLGQLLSGIVVTAVVVVVVGVSGLVKVHTERVGLGVVEVSGLVRVVQRGSD